MSAPTATEQFSGDPPLELGSIRGLRAWRIGTTEYREDKAVTTAPYVLASPVFSSYKWRDGENAVSYCSRCWLYVPLEQTLEEAPLATYRMYPSIPATINPRCTCGFYAFTDGREDFSVVGPNVTGVIEGYGRVSVGSRGFRAEKAKIVALIRDDGLPAEIWEGLAQQYPSARIFDTRAKMLRSFPVDSSTAKVVKWWRRRFRCPW